MRFFAINHKDSYPAPHLDVDALAEALAVKLAAKMKG
jgi:predicted nucleotidyltransferase component of viral defense system